MKNGSGTSLESTRLYVVADSGTFGRALVDQACVCTGTSGPAWHASGRHLSASAGKTTIEIGWHRFKEGGHMVLIR
jgi:hypothetical protein